MNIEPERMRFLPGILLKLGLKNVLAVGLYKLAIRSGIHPAQHISATLPADWEGTGKANLEPKGEAITTRLFGWKSVQVGLATDWNVNVFRQLAPIQEQLRWDIALSQIPADFDIKEIWELSRLFCLVEMAWQFRDAKPEQTETIISRINWVLETWSQQNRPYMGANWSCGQEAAIRALHLIQALFLLGESSAKIQHADWFLKTHHKRIDASISYGLAQKNNHACTEAGAIFCIGLHVGNKVWTEKGRKLLEKYIFELVQEDGGPCQYSVTYHRAVLSVFLFCELFARSKAEKCLSKSGCDRLMCGAEWLRDVVDPQTGDAPNWGANDGNFILQMPGTDYRDFRPVVELAYCLLKGEIPFGTELERKDMVQAFGLDVPTMVAPPLRNQQNRQTGLAVLRRGNVMASLHFPEFAFRPSQSDILHCDLWVAGVNLLRDSGSHSYSDPAFSSVKYHNTVEFDDHDQMPRLGKFLYGAWPETDLYEFGESAGVDEAQASASFVSYAGNIHKRSIWLSEYEFRCVDSFKSFRKQAVLRWHLPQANWRLVNGEVLGRVNDIECRLKFVAEGLPVTPNLKRGYESRYYLEKLATTVVELAFNKPTSVETRVLFEN